MNNDFKVINLSKSNTIKFIRRLIKTFIIVSFLISVSHIVTKRTDIGSIGGLQVDGESLTINKKNWIYGYKCLLGSEHSFGYDFSRTDKGINVDRNENIWEYVHNLGYRIGLNKSLGFSNYVILGFIDIIKMTFSHWLFILAIIIISELYFKYIPSIRFRISK